MASSPSLTLTHPCNKAHEFQVFCTEFCLSKLSKQLKLGDSYTRCRDIGCPAGCRVVIPCLTSSSAWSTRVHPDPQRQLHTRGPEPTPRSVIFNRAMRDWRTTWQLALVLAKYGKWHRVWMERVYFHWSFQVGEDKRRAAALISGQVEEAGWRDAELQQEVKEQGRSSPCSAYLFIASTAL